MFCLKTIFLQCIVALYDFFKMQATCDVQNQYIKGLCYGKKGFHCMRGGSARPLLHQRLTPLHRCMRFLVSSQRGTCSSSEAAKARPVPPASQPGPRGGCKTERLSSTPCSALSKHQSHPLAVSSCLVPPWQLWKASCLVQRVPRGRGAVGFFLLCPGP